MNGLVVHGKSEESKKRFMNYYFQLARLLGLIKKPISGSRLRSGFNFSILVEFEPHPRGSGSPQISADPTKRY